jgi:hypothetical protein
MKLWGMESLSNGHKPIGAIVVILLTAIIMLLVNCDNNNGVTSTQNRQPIVPEQPKPADGSIDQDLGIRLEWYCLDEDADSLTYDFYFGTSNPPGLIGTLNTYLYNHERFEYETTYYWKVVAKDGHGHEVSSPIWSFTTGRLYLVDDFPTVNNMNRVVVRPDSMIFVADDNLGLRIMQVTDTSQTGLRIDSLSTPSLTGFNYDVYVVGNYAYVATEGRNADGFYCYDVTDPSIPVQVYAADSSDHIEVYEEVRAVNVIGNYAYLAVATADSLGIIIGSIESSLRVFDVSDLNDVTPIAQVTYEGIATDIYVANNYAFIADSTAELMIFDVTDPSNPVLATEYSPGGIGLGIFVLGNTAYLANGPAGLFILDVSNPSDPILIGSYDTPGSARDVYVYGEKAFIADYWNGGLQVLDISDPANPVFFAHRDTQGGASGIFADANFIYLADRWAGLLLFQYMQ